MNPVIKYVSWEVEPAKQIAYCRKGLRDNRCAAANAPAGGFYEAYYKQYVQWYTEALAYFQQEAAAA